MRRQELEDEAKRRSKKIIWPFLLLPAVFSIVSVAQQNKELCSIENPLRSFQCPSDGHLASVTLIGILIVTVFIGLPLTYMAYNDFKWKLYGYKTPLNGNVASCLLIGLCIPIVLQNYMPGEVRIWYGVLYYLLFYGLFIFELAYYHSLKKKYKADKRRGRAPRMKKLEKAIKIEQDEIVRQAQSQKKRARKKKYDNGFYDDGL